MAESSAASVKSETNPVLKEHFATEGYYIIRNMLSPSDCQAILEVGGFFFLFALIPWQIVIAVAQLSWLLGWVWIFGLLALIGNMFLIDYLARVVMRAMVQKMRLADKRSMLLNESLQGIRTLKLYAWEDKFEERVAR